MAQAPSNNSSPSKSPRQALDDEPDFDISPELNVLRNSLGWGDVAGQIPIIGLSRQLHSLLRTYDPVRIRPEAGPYRNDVISQVISAMIVTHRQLLQIPGQRSSLRVSVIPELRAICGQDVVQFSDLSRIFRRHLVLLDVVRPSQPAGAQVAAQNPPAGGPNP